MTTNPKMSVLPTSTCLCSLQLNTEFLIMSEVRLTKVFRDTMDTKYGMRAKVAIQTETHGDKWLSTLLPMNATAGTEDWNPGDTVNIDVIEKGEFLNFKPSGTGKGVGTTGPSLESRVVRLEAQVFGADTTAKAATAPEETVIQADDLPDFGEEVDAGDGF